jgi:uncharacterized protein (DUF697 family)
VLPKTLKELDAVRATCKTMVKKRALASSGAVLVPVPGVDIAADVAMLLELLPAVNRKFGLTPEQIDELDPQLKSLLYGVIKKTGTTLVGQLITKQLIITALKKVGVRMAAKQVLKYIPIAGQAAAAALSGAAMMYVGNSHVDECYEVAKKAIDLTAGEGASA